MDTEPLAFPALTAMLKAAGESTRLRILALIAEAELTVSDLTEILRQSQPRLSRHLRLLAEAGLSASADRIASSTAASATWSLRMRSHSAAWRRK